MNLSSHVPTSSSSAKSLIASKSLGIFIATGKPVSRIRGNSGSDAASSSQARLQDAHHGGLMDKATGKLVATKEESGDVVLSESETGSEENVTGKPVAYETATGQPHASSKTDCQGSPKAEKTEWSVTQSARVSSHSSSHGSSLLDCQGELRTRTWRPSEWYGREYGFLMHISEYHSSSSSSSWTRPCREFTLREESSLEQCGTVVQWKWETDQWTKRNHWCKHQRFPRCCVDVDKLVELISSPTPKPTATPTLCSVWEKWEMILLRPGRAKLNGFRKTITSRIWIESTECRRSSSGKYSQESWRWASSRRFKV